MEKEERWSCWVRIMPESHRKKVHGEQLIDQFHAIGTENGKTSDDPVWNYKLLPMSILTLPSFLMHQLFRRGGSQSPMNLAREGKLVSHVDSVENGHRPRWTEELNLGLFSLAHAAQTFCMSACVVSTLSAINSGASAGELVHLSLAGGYVLLFNWYVNYIGKFGSRMPLVANRDDIQPRINS